MLTLDPKFAGTAGAPDVIAIEGPATEGGGIGPAAGVFDGTEPLTCLVWAGGSAPAVASPPVAWGDDAGTFDADKPLVTVSWPADAIAALSPGWWRGRVTLADQSANLAEFRFYLHEGPDAASPTPRAALHSLRDLKLECPWVESLQTDVDQTGFAAAGAEARDWIEAQALASVSATWQPLDGPTIYPWLWSGATKPVRSDYEAALAGGATFDLGGPNGRLIVKASVHYALSLIFRRAIGMASPPVDLMDGSRFHESKALDVLNRAEARIGDLPPVRFGSLVTAWMRR